MTCLVWMGFVDKLLQGSHLIAAVNVAKLSRLLVQESCYGTVHECTASERLGVTMYHRHHVHIVYSPWFNPRWRRLALFTWGYDRVCKTNYTSLHSFGMEGSVFMF